MPLNRETGEALEEFPAPHYVVPVGTVGDMRLLTTYEIPGKFRPRVARRHIVEDAFDCAAKAFAAAGAMMPLAFDESGVVIQAYPALGKLAIVVMRPIAGDEQFVVRSYDLRPAAMRALFRSANLRYPDED